MKFPPAYRKSDSEERRCSTCEYFSPVSGGCRKYNIIVQASAVCSQWEQRKTKVADAPLHFLDVEYMAGFAAKCAELGIDPETLVRR